MTSLGDVAPISLAELGERAALMTRVDRKYLVPLEVAASLLPALDGGLRVLEIEGRCTFGYRSVYYDTAELAGYRAAATGRRRRFKVRRRDYLDTGASYLEVKTRTGRGESRKHRVPVPTGVGEVGGGSGGEAGMVAGDGIVAGGGVAGGGMPGGGMPVGGDGALAGSQLAYVREILQMDGCPAPDAPLLPVLDTTYDRTTLLIEDEDSRVTIDSELTWSDPSGARRRTLQDLVVVETKAGSRPGAADRLLWAQGHRPLRLSKYATGMALLRGDLAANRWHRTLTTVRADAA